MSALALLLALCGCAPVGPNYLRPAAILSPQYKEIAGWKIASPRDAEIKRDWWTSMHDAELDRLEPMISVTNQNVAAAEANYRQALALVAEARASLFPTLGLAPSAERDSALGTVLSVQGSVNWTLDIWGEARRQVESQEANAEKLDAALANARLASQLALALAYVQLRQADSAQTMLAATSVEFRKALEITRDQYKAGTAQSSDVDRADSNLMAAKADEVESLIARSKDEHAIAVLVGQPPEELAIARGALPASMPAPPIVLPSELLERRPDIAAAERAMAQANAEIGVAFAGYFPRVSLTGSYGYTNASSASQALSGASHLLQQVSGAGAAWNFGLSLSQALFDAGATDARAAAARAAYEASVASYRQTVLTALQSVEDQLGSIHRLERERAYRSSAVKDDKHALDVIFQQYQAGAQTYVNVSTADTVWLTDQEAELTTRAASLSAVVNLVAALGGGWDATELAADAGK